MGTQKLSLTRLLSLTRHCLFNSSAIAAILIITPLDTSRGADVNVTTPQSTTVTVTETGDTVSVTGSGDIAVTGGDGVDTNGNTGVNVTVDTNSTTTGISSTGGLNAAIDARNASTTVDTIAITNGTVTSENANPAGGTIDISGAGGTTTTTTINIGTGGSVTNTATMDGTAINFDDDAMPGANYTINITNAGTIQTQAGTNAQAISTEINGGGNGVDLTVNNTGTISGGSSTSAAINHAAAGTLPLTVTNSGNGSIIGEVGSSSAGTATITNSDNATMNGNITATSLTFNLNGGTVTGNVTGGTGISDININGGTLNGNVSLGSNAGSTLELSSGTLNGGVVFNNVDQTFTISSTTPTTITGSIKGGSTGNSNDGEGQVIVATGADVTFNGEFGRNPVDIDSFVVQSGAKATLNSVDAFLQHDGGMLAVDVDGELVLNTTNNPITVLSSGQGEGDIDIDGTVSIIGSNNAILSNASTNMSGMNPGIGRLSIDGALSTLLTGGATTTIVTAAGPGTLTIGANSDTTITAGNQIVTESDLTLGSGSTNTVLNIRKTASFDPTTTPVFDATGDEINVAGPLEVGIDASSLSFNDGDMVTVIDSDTNATTDYATLVGNGTISFRDTPFLDLEDDGSDAQDLKFIIAVKTSPDGSTDLTRDALRNAYLATASDPDARAALQGLNAAQTNNAGLELLADPTAGAALTQATTNNLVSGFDLVSSRLTEVRDGSNTTGLASGEKLYFGNKDAIWLRSFGTVSDQDMRSAVQGYDADAAGVMMGGDVLLESDVRVGLYAGYVATDVDPNGPGNHDMDFDTFRTGIYGGKDFENFYVEGQASFGYNSIDTSRHVTFGGLNRRVKGDTHGFEYGVRVGAGIPLAVDEVQTVTPYTNFHYIHTNVDSYTESGGSSLNMRVNPDNTDIAELSVGVHYSAEFEYAGGKLRPEVHAAAAHDFVGDTSGSAQEFTGGGATFKIRGADVAKYSALYGAGIAWETGDEGWKFALNYNGKAKADFISHGLLFEATMRF